MQVRTAQEIVKDAGFDPAQIGKVRVRVGGIPVSKPDHLISIPDDASEVEVIVGTESKKATYATGPEHDVSKEAQKVEEAQGREATKAIEAREAEKNTPTEKDATDVNVANPEEKPPV